MKLPKFRPSNRFLGEFDIPCFTAVVRNSKLPGIATWQNAGFHNNPECKITLRGHSAQAVSKWHIEIIQDLFEKENLAAAVNEGMNEYLASNKWGGKNGAEIDDDDRKAVLDHGFASYIAITNIILDEVAKEVILCAHTTIDGNLNEHGIVIYFKKRRWRFETDEYFCGYCSRIEGIAAPPKEELVKREWERLFPIPEVGTSVKIDPGLMIGRWQFDKPESRKFLKQLSLKLEFSTDDISEYLREFEDYWLEVTKTSYRMFSPTPPYSYISGKRLHGYERRGTRIRVRISWKAENVKSKEDETCEYWCDGSRLVSNRGAVYRKTDKIPTAPLERRDLNPLPSFETMFSQFQKLNPKWGGS